MILLAGLALAHVPHSVITSVANAPDLDTARPWFSTHDYGGATTLMRSDDAGDTWSAVAADPTRDVLLDAGWTSDGQLVLLSEGRCWWSEDAGASWSQAPLDATAVRLATGDGVAVATDDGLRVGTGSDLLAVAVGESFTDVSAGPGGFAAVGDTLWIDGGTGAWVPLDGPGGTVTRALAAEDALYAGRSDGSVWRLDGDAWTPCGETPFEALDYPSVVALASDGAQLAVASASQGPAVSQDGCATWTNVAAPLDSSFGGAGGAKDNDETTSVLAIAGDRLVQAGWAGLAYTADGGTSWEKRAVLPPDLYRGVALSPDFERDGVVLLGGFSGGVDRSDDGGRTWSSTGLGLVAPNIQQILFAPGDPTRVYADANHTLVRSRDGGLTWEDVDVACGSACHGWSVIADGSLWQAGVPVDGNPFNVASHAAVSRDGGVTWADVAGLDAGVEWDNFIDTTERLCVTGDDQLVCSADSGATWTTVRDGGGRVIAIVEVGDVALVSVEEEGVYRVAGGESTLVRDGVDDPVFTLSRADDDTLFATTRGARVLRSEDAGVSWADLGVTLTAAVPAVALRANFAAHPDVLLASYDGGWLLQVADPASEPPLERFGRYERVDNSSGFMQAEGTTTVQDREAALGSCAALAPSSTLFTLVRGTRVRVLGRAGGSSQAAVLLDGVEQAVVGGEVVDSAQGVVWDSGELADGWHHVELVGRVGEDLCVDGIEATAPGAALDLSLDSGDTADTGSEPRTRCGCGGESGSAAGLLGLGALALGRRRRVG